VFRGTFDFEAVPFDWGQGYRKPEIPLQDLVVAELPVRLFTGGWVGLAGHCTGGRAGRVHTCMGGGPVGPHLLGFCLPAVRLTCGNYPACPPVCVRCTALRASIPCPAASESSGLPAGQRGTYAGLAAKVDHLKELGINAGKPVLCTRLRVALLWC
jgi:hypothetical protein